MSEASLVMLLCRFVIAVNFYEHAGRQLVQTIRRVEAKYKHPIGILADLQGPKLRVGVFKDEKVRLMRLGWHILSLARAVQWHVL